MTQALVIRGGTVVNADRIYVLRDGELAESGAVAVVRTPEELEQFILTH